MPPLSPGVLRLYSMAFCPFAERTRLVLAAKGIKYELVNVNTYQKPEWFVEKNPDQLVPVLEQDDKLVQESLVTCEYLDELYPKTAPMFPSDPYLKAKDKVFIQKIGNVISALFKSAREKGANEEFRNAFLKQVESLEEELKSRGTDFFSGSSPGMVDYALWPFIYRAPPSKALGGDGAFPQSCALLNKWIQRMRNHEVVAPRIMEDAALREFSDHYRTADTRFDQIQTKSIE